MLTTMFDFCAAAGGVVAPCSEGGRGPGVDGRYVADPLRKFLQTLTSDVRFACACDADVFGRVVARLCVLACDFEFFELSMARKPARARVCGGGRRGRGEGRRVGVRRERVDHRAQREQ